MRFGLVALACFAFVACGDNGGDARPTPTVPATPAVTPSPESPSPPGDPGVTVEQAIQACREKDGDRLRSFIADEVSEEAIQELFERGTDVRLAGRTPPAIEDGRAIVAVRLEVRRSGELETVDRVWELERGSDGVWRFTSLPDCF